ARTEVQHVNVALRAGVGNYHRRERVAEHRLALVRVAPIDVGPTRRAGGVEHRVRLDPVDLGEHARDVLDANVRQHRLVAPGLSAARSDKALTKDENLHTTP